MSQLNLSKWNLGSYVAAIAAPVIVFLLVVLAPIPVSISRPFQGYSFLLFAAALILYYIGFRLPGVYAWIAAACLTLLFLGLRLSFLWSSAYSNDKILGGLVPFRDGFDYYNGAKLLLSGNVITNINEGAAWRPLYPGFLSSLLLITGQDLQWALIVQIGLAGLCFSLAGILVARCFGAPSAALFLSLVDFYIQRLIGTTYTETLGLSLGCLGFVLLVAGAKGGRWRAVLIGLVVLMPAVSERAGAFFVFPALVLWAGWAFRGDKRFSFRYGGLALLTIGLTYLVVNTIYDKLIVEPGGYPFGNFAWTLYGQVTGGSGYARAFQELGVRRPDLIFRAAERFFLAHPLSFFIGAAKAYRDFFLPDIGPLAFGHAWIDVVLWAFGTGLLLFGIYIALRRFRLPVYSLLIAVLVGILLSIPFLPPIDGGVRIYASTMPFFYVLPCLGLAALLRTDVETDIGPAFATASAGVSLLVLVLMVVVPVGILYMSPRPAFAMPVCPAGQVPYAAILSPRSYIDLASESPGACHTRVPDVCLSDFSRNRGSNDPSDAAVFDAVQTQATATTSRIFVANDMVGARPHLFSGPAAMLGTPANQVIAGCATEIRIAKRPSVYVVQSVEDR